MQDHLGLVWQPWSQSISVRWWCIPVCWSPPVTAGLTSVDWAGLCDSRGGGGMGGGNFLGLGRSLNDSVFEIKTECLISVFFKY